MGPHFLAVAGNAAEDFQGAAGNVVYSGSSTWSTAMNRFLLFNRVYDPRFPIPQRSFALLARAREYHLALYTAVDMRSRIPLFYCKLCASLFFCVLNIIFQTFKNRYIIAIMLVVQ